MSPDFALAIVGGGPAGLSAARGYRDAGGAGAVAIVAAEERMPYNRPPLTKELLRGDVEEATLPLEDEGWLVSNDVSLIGGVAMAIDPGEHVIALAGGRRLGYGQCVVATGAEPRRLPVPGADDPAVRAVRSLDHVRELLARLSDGDRVIVVGSGFIGCEIAASLRRRGHPVTLISEEPAPNQQRLGPQPAAAIARWLAEDGVTPHFGVQLDAIQRSGDGAQLRACAGDLRADAPVVVMAVGVAPRSELLAACGIQLHDGAVPADEHMRTERDDLFAAGDVCLAENAAAGRPLRVEHWGDALAQGEIAGRVAAGEDARWESVPGFWSTIGDRTLKYAAWGDGYDDTRFDQHPDGGFTAWYGREGVVVGVLTHRSDADYERGGELIARGASWTTR